MSICAEFSVTLQMAKLDKQTEYLKDNMTMLVQSSLAFILISTVFKKKKKNRHLKRNTK